MVTRMNGDILRGIFSLLDGFADELDGFIADGVSDDPKIIEMWTAEGKDARKYAEKFYALRDLWDGDWNRIAQLVKRYAETMEVWRDQAEEDGDDSAVVSWDDSIKDCYVAADLIIG